VTTGGDAPAPSDEGGGEGEGESEADAPATGVATRVSAGAVRYGPGLALMVAVAAAARVLGSLTGFSSLAFAVGGAALAANAVGVPEWARPGLDRHKLLLETGIVLLGAGLTFGQLARAGPVVVGLAAVAVLVGVASVELLCRWAGVRERASALVASGAAVCGVSAVVAVAGGIDADESDVAYAVGTVLLFDAVTLVAFPAAASFLGLDARTFGVWAGLSMFSTGPVAAAGFAHSPAAGRWATLTKLVRNALIGLVVVAYSLRYARRAARAGGTTGADDAAGTTDDAGTVPDGGAAGGDATRGRAASTLRGGVAEVWDGFPKFVVGFLAAAVLANTVMPGVSAPAGTAADALFAVAFAGLGFDIRLEAVRDAGLAPVLAVGVHLLAWSAVALTVVTLLL
jgi:uncharacterized membrane protein YadS